MDGENRKRLVQEERERKTAKLEGKTNKYNALLHAMQTGVAWEIAFENPEVVDINKDPILKAMKHLRTGINSAKSDQGALAKLLIDKGVFTEEEYYDYIIDFMDREVTMMQDLLETKFGVKITLR